MDAFPRRAALVDRAGQHGHRSDHDDGHGARVPAGGADATLQPFASHADMAACTHRSPGSSGYGA